MFRSLLGFFLGSSTRKAWYDSSELRNECIHTAETLLRLYPTARFFALGQTPAWIVKSISLIQANKDSANEVGYIPFSGRFYALKKGRADQDYQYNEMVYTFHPASEPKPMHEALYRMLLVDLGADPETIIEKAQAGTKTVLIDYIGQGCGLASFLSILFLWAKELNLENELRDALKVRVIIFPYLGKMTQHFDYPDDDFYVECLPLVMLPHVIPHWSEGVDTGPYSDRLVASYPHTKWGKPPKLSAAHQANLEHISKLLMDEFALLEKQRAEYAAKQARPKPSGNLFSVFQPRQQTKKQSTQQPQTNCLVQ